MKTISSMKKVKEQSLRNHPPAKGAPELTEDERSDLERFKELYDDTIVASQDTSRLVETDGFHPSSLGTYSGNCMRRSVYLLQGVAKNPNFTPRILTVFANGHAVHDRIQKTIEAAGAMLETEVEITYEDPPISGHADGVIVLPWNGRKILLEIKSANESTFSSRLKWKKGKDEHFAQANIYAYILDIDTIWIMYENKDNQEYEIFEHKASPKKAEQIIKKWRKAYAIFEQGELPERPYKPDNRACMYCDLREHCFSDPEIGVSLNGKKKETEKSADDEYEPF